MWKYRAILITVHYILLTFQSNSTVSRSGQARPGRGKLIQMPGSLASMSGGIIRSGLH